MGKIMLDNNLFKEINVSGVQPGCVIYPPKGTYGPRVQQDLQLVYLDAGSMKVYIDNEEYHIPTGCVALLKPGHLEQFTFSEKEESWHRWIAINVDGLSEEDRQSLSQLPLYIPISLEMNRLLELMLSADKENHDFMKAMGLGALHLYIIESKQRENRNINHVAVIKAKKMMQQKYAESLRLEHIAQEVNVSAEHLIRLFQKHENTTPIQYLWQYRADKGVEFLKNTGLSISEITERCGFKTTYHFARVIKKHTGLTPTQIRRKSWQAK